MDITVPPSTINTVSTTLPATADGARMARAFVSEALRIWGLEEVAGDVVSVASELVINVIVHTEGRPVLELQVCADRIRIEVRDASPVLPVVGSHDARGAWGLTTVE
jgi:anti-sigma regulatory factor (Ser/Thr protein kinase)